MDGFNRTFDSVYCVLCTSELPLFFLLSRKLLLFTPSPSFSLVTAGWLCWLRYKEVYKKPNCGGFRVVASKQASQVSYRKSKSELGKWSRGSTTVLLYSAVQYSRSKKEKERWKEGILEHVPSGADWIEEGAETGNSFFACFVATKINKSSFLEERPAKCDINPPFFTCFRGLFVKPSTTFRLVASSRWAFHRSGEGDLSLALLGPFGTYILLYTLAVYGKLAWIEGGGVVQQNSRQFLSAFGQPNQNPLWRGLCVYTECSINGLEVPSRVPMKQKVVAFWWWHNFIPQLRITRSVHILYTRWVVRWINYGRNNLGLTFLSCSQASPFLCSPSLLIICIFITPDLS